MANFCYPNPFLSATAAVEQEPYQQQYAAYYPPTQHARFSDQKLPLQLSNQRWYQRQQQEWKLKQESEQLLQQAVQEHHEEEMKYRKSPFSKEHNTLYTQGYHTANDYDDEHTHQLQDGCSTKVLLARTPMEIHNLYEECDRRESSGKKTACMMMLTLLLAVIIVAATGGAAFPLWSVSSPSSSPSSDMVTNNNDNIIIISGMEEIVIAVGIADGVNEIEEVVVLVSEKVEDTVNSIIDTGNKEDIIDTTDKEETGDTTTMWADIMCIIRLVILALCLRYVDKKWNDESDNDDTGYDDDLYDSGCHTTCTMTTVMMMMMKMMLLPNFH